MHLRLPPVRGLRPPQQLDGPVGIHVSIDAGLCRRRLDIVGVGVVVQRRERFDLADHVGRCHIRRDQHVGAQNGDNAIVGKPDGDVRLQQHVERVGQSFELVWGFSCQAVVLGCADSFLFGAGKAVFSSRRLRSGSRSARKGSRDRNGSKAWRLAA